MTGLRRPSLPNSGLLSWTEPLACRAEEGREMTNEFDGVFSEVEKQYMPSVLAKVRDRAKDLATKDNREEPNYIDVFRAFENSLWFFTALCPT